MAGLAAGRALENVPLLAQLVPALAAALAALRFSTRDSRYWAAALAVAAFCAGSASYGLARARLSDWDTLPPREIQASLRIERLFAATDPRKCSGIARIVRTDGPMPQLIGQRVSFSASRRSGDPVPQRSAILSAVGVLTPLPHEAAPDSFDGYLASNGVNFRLARARLVAVEERPHAYYRFCDAALARFDAILGWGIAGKRPALAGLLRAMMLGQTRELTDDQHTIFMQSGTMHLFAISGLNIAVIATSLHAILSLLRPPAWVRFALGTPLLWLFVDITGGSPSAVRAFAMATFLQAAFVLRRPTNPFAALVGSAAVVLAFTPLQLFSASFLMSYGIVVALLVLGLPLSEAWLNAWQPWRDVPKGGLTRGQKLFVAAGRWLILAVAIGVATTLVSMITSVEYFQLLTPGALVANLALIPAAMVVTLGGFVALCCGLVGFTAGAILCNHAAALVLWAIESMVRLSVHVPGAFIPAHFRAPWIGSAALATVLLALLFGYGTGWQRRYGAWWPPFAIVALTLTFGVTFG